MNNFDFGEALAYINAGMKVSLTLNGKKRYYFLNDDNKIVCQPLGKSFLTYKVKNFHIDAIMSNDWTLESEEEL